MKVSVSMATYNGQSYIEEQLNSILNQTRKPDELVISDDGSTDCTVSIIKSFMKKAPFDIRLICNDLTLGYSQNFNSSLSNTSGDIIFLSDQDDVWYPEKIQVMLDTLDEYPNYLVYMNNAELTDSKLKPTSLTKIGQIRSIGLGLDAFVMGCCCMLRKDFLDFCLPIPPKYPAHDDWLVTIADGLNLKYVNEDVLQYYRRHETNESNFIPNRLTKVTPKDIWISRFKQLVFNRAERHQKARLYLEQSEVFVNGLILLKPLVPESLKESFVHFLEIKTDQLRILKLRYKLRKTFFLKRIWLSIWYFFFVYNKESRLKNMLRDIFS